MWVGGGKGKKRGIRRKEERGRRKGGEEGRGRRREDERRGRGMGRGEGEIGKMEKQLNVYGTNIISLTMERGRREQGGKEGRRKEVFKLI